MNETFNNNIMAIAAKTNADVRGSTLAHYSQHVSAVKSSGARHLSQEASSNATHSLLRSSSGMPKLSGALASPNLASPMNGETMPPPEPRAGQEIGSGLF